MQFPLIAAALVATVSAGLDKIADKDTWGNASIVNRCPYDVYVWSIDKEEGCPTGAAHKLATGGKYSEPYRLGKNGGGISLKISKFDTCGGKDLTQLEYQITADKPKYNGNYLDMSFVDCTKNLEDCPGRTDGFFMKAGNQLGAFRSAVNNEHCPVFNVNNAEEAARVSYIKWDDPQTKFCDETQDLDLYLCGGHAPGDEDDESSPVESATPSSSSEIESTSTPSPTSTSEKETPTPSSTDEGEDEFAVMAAAAVTPAPVEPVPVEPVVKTEVVYVTQFVKRHAHGRRHQHFHA